MHFPQRFTRYLTGLLCLAALPVLAQEIVLEQGEDEVRKRRIALPFVFNTETLGTGYGVFGAMRGYFQPQQSTFGAVFGSSKEAVGGTLAGRDYRIPYTQRLFVSPRINLSHLPEIRAYTGDNPGFEDEFAGSNDSSEDNFQEEEGSTTSVALQFRYHLPLGVGRDNPLPTYVVADGIRVDGPPEGAWNPIASGRTHLLIEPFYRRQNFELDAGDQEVATNGIRVGIEYDNRDFPRNPTRGSRQRFQVTRDFGLFDSSNSYTFLEAETSFYYPLGAGWGANQRVLAFNAWTAYSPTWDEQTEDGEVRIRNRPPYFTGAQLGGVERLRGYATNRFSDQAAIYYGIEYRHMLRWNPVKRYDWLSFIPLDQLQLVGFGELGRVASDWSLGELHSDMKGSGGIGLRAMLNKSIVRLDAAYSEESFQIWGMASHSF